MAKDYYELLGIHRNATEADLKRAYRRLAHEHHPDKNRGDKSSEEKFKEINEAYEVLSDPEKRAYYDQYGAAPGALENTTRLRPRSLNAVAGATPKDVA